MDRLKNLLWGCIFAIIASAMFSGAYFSTRGTQLLAKNGHATIGTVLDESRARTKAGRRKVSVFRHEIAFDGHRKIFDLDYEIPSGTRVRIVYLQSDPKVAVIAKNKVSVWGDVQEAGVIYVVIFMAVMLLFAISALIYFWKFVVGAKHPS